MIKYKSIIIEVSFDESRRGVALGVNLKQSRQFVDIIFTGFVGMKTRHAQRDLCLIKGKGLAFCVL